MDGKIRRSASRVLALALAFALCLSMVPVAAQADGNGTYREVTENLTDWSGEYLLVYEAKDGTAYVFNGSLVGDALDAVSNYVSATISNGTITADRAYSVTVEAVTGGYVIKAASGSYIYAPSDNNALATSSNQSTADNYPITFAVTSDGIDIQLQSDPHMRFNSASNQMRFRYYKSGTYTNQQPVTLYRLEDGGSGGTAVAAPQASPQAGSVTSGTQITLSTTTSGATIYYTLNGDEPTGAASTTEFLYSAPFAITGEVNDIITLKAIAVKDGVTSTVQTISYTFLYLRY